MRYVFLLLSAAWLLGGCTQELPLPSISGEKRIVLLGELVAGDTVCVRGGISLPVVEGSVLQPEYPTDLAVTMTSTTEPPLLLQCGGADPSLKTVPLFAPQPVVAGATYTLNAIRPGLKSATAQVPIPKPFEATILDTVAVRYGGTSALRMTIRIHDRADERNFYTFEAVRQGLDVRGRFDWEGRGYALPESAEGVFLLDSLRQNGIFPHVDYDTTALADYYLRLDTYTDDDATENVRLSSTVLPVRRVLLTDETFNGGVHDLRVYVDRSYFAFPSLPGDTNTTGLGRIAFWVKSVSADYFKYLRSYETFAPTTGIGALAQPVRIEGNVTDGYGVVGGAYRIPFYYVFDRWPY